MSLEIKVFSVADIPKVKKFTDQVIGIDYYSEEELDKKCRASIKDDQTSSLVLWDKDEVVGLRLCFPPGQWKQGKGEQLSPDLWPHPLSETAYFQSLYIAHPFQNQGWGKKLSLKAIDILKQMSAKGVVCHSWVESPGDSSRRYLKSMNFKSINTYPEYWKNVDYVCSLDGSPCLCTAEEMYLDFQEVS